MEKVKTQLLHGMRMPLLGAGLGILGGMLILLWVRCMHLEPKAQIFWLLAAFAELVLASWVQVVLHETGHLLFGLLTGYRFALFRIGNLALVRRRGELQLRRLSIPGTGGQCLLEPPEPYREDFPAAGYLLGGVYLNLITSALALTLWLFCRDHAALSLFLLLLAAFGLLYAGMNGLPRRRSLLENDGSTVLSLRRDPAARRALWQQLIIHARLTEGQGLRDMPEEWFRLPENAGEGSPLTAAVEVLACQRLLDEGRLEEADEAIRQLLIRSSAVPGLQRYLLTLDRVYCCLMLDRTEEADRLYASVPPRLRKKLGGFLSVQRTEYARAALGDRDSGRAEAILARFARQCRDYPYPAEAEGEARLAALAARRGWFSAD